ncbi:Small secreted protein [Fusarium sp. LHS14.1]|nr:Small secreted protein [Fusarium sp. LHS14.1]
MKFSTVLLSFAATAFAAPLSKRAVFSTSTYNDLSISGGTAGNAAQEALQKLGGLPNDLTTVEKSDIDFLNSVNQICNDAEKEAFNTAIDAASGEEADALQRGKIKNKVLKLTATMLKLQIQQAQGEDVAADMETENKKLQNNISQDEEAAGQASTFLSFDATTD